MLTTSPSNLIHRLVFFAGIGGTAAVVHLLVVLNLVHFFNIEPLIANLFAFLLAFNISFLGHKHLTFSKLKNEKQLSLPHFFIVAASAGMLNEFIYYMFLQYSNIHYMVALVFVIGLVSMYTFVLSKFWACR